MSASTTPAPSLPAPTRVVRAVVGRRTVIDVLGEIDIASVGQLTQAVDQALDDGALEIWIDLSATDFMDSSGLHVLLAAQSRAHDLRRKLAVICPGGSIRRLFEVSGVDERLPIHADRAAANRAG